MEENLTLKQSTFVNAYVSEAKGNGTKAAQIAGYKGNDPQLAVIASQNLRKLQVQNAIETEKEQLRQQFAERRKGLLADVDDVKQEIFAVREQFNDNPGVRSQMVARMFDAINTEAKLTGAFVKDAENPVTVTDVKQQLAAALEALGPDWTPERIAQATKRPIASLVGAQELGEAD